MYLLIQTWYIFALSIQAKKKGFRQCRILYNKLCQFSLPKPQHGVKNFVSGVKLDYSNIAYEDKKNTKFTINANTPTTSMVSKQNNLPASLPMSPLISAKFCARIYNTKCYFHHRYSCLCKSNMREPNLFRYSCKLFTGLIILMHVKLKANELIITLSFWSW